MLQVRKNSLHGIEDTDPARRLASTVARLTLAVLAMLASAAPTRAIFIDNGIFGDGSWVVDSELAGDSRSGEIDPFGTQQASDVIFHLGTYVDAGIDGKAVFLGNTALSGPEQTGTAEVTSSGRFAGPNSDVDWTAVATIPPGSTVYQVALSFSSPEPFGPLRVINYLDEDVLGSPDILVVLGSPGGPDFQLLTIDADNDLGVAQTAGFLSAVNMRYVGWAADRFPDLENAIEGNGTFYSPTGSVDTADLPPMVDRRFPNNRAFGISDISTAFAFDLNDQANSAFVVFSLGGAPTATTPPPPPDSGSVLVTPSSLILSGFPGQKVAANVSVAFDNACCEGVLVESSQDGLIEGSTGPILLSSTASIEYSFVIPTGTSPGQSFSDTLLLSKAQGELPVETLSTVPVTINVTQETGDTFGFSPPSLALNGLPGETVSADVAVNFDPACCDNLLVNAAAGRINDSPGSTILTAPSSVTYSFDIPTDAQLESILSDRVTALEIIGIVPGSSVNLPVTISVTDTPNGTEPPDLKLDVALGVEIFLDPTEDDAGQVARAAPQGNVSLGVDPSKAVIEVGDKLVYTATVNNSGPTTAFQTSVVGNLPAGLDYEGGLPGCFLKLEERTVTCALGDLGVGQSAKASVSARVGPSAPGTVNFPFNVQFNGGGGASGSANQNNISQINVIEPPDQTRLAFLNTTFTVRESVGTIQIMVRRLGPASAGAAVDYASRDGTATAGDDYTGVSGILDWDAGRKYQVFNVPILADTLAENDEGVFLQIENVSGDATLLGPDTVTLAILDTGETGLFGGGYAVTGSWAEVNKATDGQGFSLDYLPEANVLIVYWFTYDTAGIEQMWLQGAAAMAGNVAVVPLIRPENGKFDDPKTVDLGVDWGTVTLRFSTATLGTASYTSNLDGVIGTIPIERITPAIGCKPAGSGFTGALDEALTGSWNNSQTNGQGFSLELIALPTAKVLLVYWFTFDTTGTKQMWMAGSGIVAADGKSAEITLVRPQNGKFDDPTRPVDTSEPVWGTATVTLNDFNNGTVQYESSLDNVTGSIAIRRIVPPEVTCEAAGFSP